jgi:hypothetical protein
VLQVVAGHNLLVPFSQEAQVLLEIMGEVQAQILLLIQAAVAAGPMALAVMVLLGKTV